jgi:hypothetical protein
MTNDTVIEVRGGCVVAMYSGDRDQRFILLDWDDLNELPEPERTARLFPQDSLGVMPPDTRCVFERVVPRDRDCIQ